MSNYKVHIAYGFHVNCYHSYRGDTNDKQGFGGDIRIIRKIIKTLNEFNENGIDVKATWDFENAYSIEDILPKYAPDILEDVKTRVERYGDENIIMGYNNGALSAMNEEELSASINLAVTNDKKSGLNDVFGECEMIVRPQEVMFSPSQVSVYNKLGVKALCIYYSCVPFDGFRTFIPQLDDEKAFNPLTYTYNGESLTIVPTYNNSDLIDAGCLRNLAKDLHKKQESGAINSDVLIFTNMDADAIFWETILPSPFNKIANTDGIHGLVSEVADLDFVQFNTVGGYLKDHKPLGEISFTQDTADGGFSGYVNWSEKPFNCQIWTRLERARAYAKLAKSDYDSPSFDDRIMLLSTTHFGLASPVLNIEREKKALSFSEHMVKAELDNLKKKQKMTVNNISNKKETSLQITLSNGYLKDIKQLRVVSDDVKSFSGVAMDYYNDGSIKTVMLLIAFKTLKKSYEIEFSNTHSKKQEKPLESSKNYFLKTDNMEIAFTKSGHIARVKYKNKIIGDSQFMRKYITYDNERYLFETVGARVIDTAGKSKAVEIYGEIHLPNELESGNFSYVFYTFDDYSGIYVANKIKYPYTKEETEISTESSALGRKTDIKWTETVPFSMTPYLRGNVSVVKRNYMDDISSYSVTDFSKSIIENNELDSFNHHLTNGLIALSNGEVGFAFGIAKQVQNSMACCPMRLRDDDLRFKVSMNPFGTYFGRQRKYPTRGNNCACESFVIVSPQARSIAPAYNGVCQHFCGVLLGFDGNEPKDKVLDELIGFAEGSATVNGADKNVVVFDKDNVDFKAIRKNEISDDDLKSAAFSGNISDKKSIVKTALKVGYNILSKEIKSYI